MKKSLVLFLLITAISLVSFGYVLAGQPPKDCDQCKAWVSEQCSQPGMDKDCEKNMYESACGQCSSGGSKGGTQAPVIYIRPEDNIGEYDINDNNGKDYVSFKNWDDCMNYFGDADKCSKIVTNACQSCLGTCRELERKGMPLSRSCGEICNAECAGIGSGSGVVDPGSGGEDDYGKYYFENGQKKYSTFNDFHGCWSILGDARECVSKYGYGCRYKNGFYIAYLCKYDDEDSQYDCINRVNSEYVDACGGHW